MKCNSRSPVDGRRCQYQQGHVGQHYAEVPWQRWGAESKPGSAPRGYGADAARDLKRHVRAEALRLAKEGVPLPKSVRDEPIDWSRVG